MWIVHAIERTYFMDLPSDLEGEVLLYVSWQEIESTLKRVVRRNGNPAARIP